MIKELEYPPHDKNFIMIWDDRGTLFTAKLLWKENRRSYCGSGHDIGSVQMKNIICKCTTRFFVNEVDPQDIKENYTIDLNDPIMGREKFAEMLLDVLTYNVRDCRNEIRNL
jgi:hypothetical protein